MTSLRWVPHLFLPASLCALNLRDSLDPNFAERKILLIKGGGDQYKANPHQQHRQACENRLCYELTDQTWTFEFANTNFELVVTYSYLTHQYSAELFYWQDQDKVVVPIRPE